MVVITGTDKGTTGVVLRALPKENRVIVQGVHVRAVHTRSTKGKGKGSIVKKEMPIHASNVKKADTKSPKKKR